MAGEAHRKWRARGQYDKRVSRKDNNYIIPRWGNQLVKIVNESDMRLWKRELEDAEVNTGDIEQIRASGWPSS
ncbi:hypothetical protein [Nonomuraea sp. NPDC050540]|uniref:hypothetical protein n=1 Tax=Nonomuraea sp. NPDC050540 TaxID=3364367 RepID=UPI0037A74DDF